MVTRFTVENIEAIAIAVLGKNALKTASNYSKWDISKSSKTR